VERQFERGGGEVKRHIPVYETPENFTCPGCGETNCKIVPNLNEFDYAGTHCTHGRGGTHYPSDWGYPVTDCCGADAEDATGIISPRWSNDYYDNQPRICDDDGPDNRRDL
jgi:hypothetical protein